MFWVSLVEIVGIWGFTAKDATLMIERDPDSWNTTHVYTPESRGSALLITEKIVVCIDVYGNNKEYNY